MTDVLNRSSLGEKGPLKVNQSTVEPTSEFGQVLWGLFRQTFTVTNDGDSVVFLNKLFQCPVKNKPNNNKTTDKTKQILQTEPHL